MQTETSPIIKEILLQAPVTRVWKALTNKEDMKQWYFDLAEFKPEIGFEFQFYGGTEEKQYLHLCKVKEAVDNKKLTYSWRYDGFVGESFVSFELFEEGDATRLKLTHSGLETFAGQHTDLDASNFNEGWNYIVFTSLKEFVEKNRT